MKKITYVFNAGTKDEPSLTEKTIICTADGLEENIAIAAVEAVGGEYTVEDDGTPEPVADATADEILNALLGVE